VLTGQTAYAVTFAAFLPFWGRVADLYSAWAKPVFWYGFLLNGIANPRRFLSTRAILLFHLPSLERGFRSCNCKRNCPRVTKIAYMRKVPSAYRLVSAIFDSTQIKVAIIFLTVTGSIANSTGKAIIDEHHFDIFSGIIVGGAIELDGQMAGWRWFQRFMAALAIPFVSPGTPSYRC